MLSAQRVYSRGKKKPACMDVVVICAQSNLHLCLDSPTWMEQLPHSVRFLGNRVYGSHRQYSQNFLWTRLLARSSDYQIAR